MKVGTDGVLLGAWTKVQEGNVLDIGTGTGLIAIMLAQRSETSIIDAIEIESNAFKEAIENINLCMWSERISASNCSIQEYQSNKKYNTIISNPPFFVDSTNALNPERNIARHTKELPFSDLIDAVNQLLISDGIFSIILPITEAKKFVEHAKNHNLFLNRECIVKPNSTKPAKRVLLEFSFTKRHPLKEELTIETDTRHHYTKEYISLTQDFYLNL